MSAYSLKEEVMKHLYSSFTPKKYNMADEVVRYERDEQGQLCKVELVERSSPLTQEELTEARQEYLELKRDCLNKEAEIQDTEKELETLREDLETIQEKISDYEIFSDDEEDDDD